jgi:methionine-rich copper-binding protein CopC
MIRTPFAALMLAVCATASLAHSKSEDTTPANDATVQTVDEISIRFNDPMRVTAITLTGQDGVVEVDRETGVEPVTEFLAAPAAVVPAGVYTVEWRGLSVDGHPMQGTFGFTVSE